MGSTTTRKAQEISQSMLAEFLELKREKDRAGQRFARHRELILTLLESGADVEPGTIECRVRVSEQRRFSGANLEAILGGDEVEDLRSQLPAIVVRALLVFET